MVVVKMRNHRPAAERVAATSSLAVRYGPRRPKCDIQSGVDAVRPDDRPASRNSHAAPLNNSPSCPAGSALPRGVRVGRRWSVGNQQ